MTAASLVPRRASGRTAPLAVDACPRLAPGVAFDETAHDAMWIASINGVPSSRLSRPVVELLTAMDGMTPLHVLHERFAATESSDGFLQLVGRFRDNGLLEGSAVRPPGRLTYRPPFTVQIATLRAPAVFDRLDRMLLPLSRRVLIVIVSVLGGAGAIAAILQAGELRGVLIEPVPVLGIVVLAAALPLATLLHESAHGLTLARFGGRPRRAGVMLFYLTPAFFVDVTDGWRLSSRRRRAAVALAGPAVHALVAAGALLAALVVPLPTVRHTLQLLALSCVVVVLVNLIPFVRFDGYIALMSALDEPNLRARAIGDGSAFLSQLLFGGPRPRSGLDRWWSVPFGLASLLAPAVLVTFAVVRMAQALSGGGPVLGLLVVALEAVVLLVGLGVLARALLRILRSGVSRPRFFAVVVVLVGLVVATGAVVTVPATASAGFVAHGDRVVLVRAAGDAEGVVRGGAPVVLLTRGIVANERIAEGTAVPQPPEPTRVPLDALFPVRAEGVSVPAVIIAGVEVSGGGRGLPSTGQARIDLGTGTLWQRLWELAVVSPLAPLLGAHEEG